MDGATGFTVTDVQDVRETSANTVANITSFMTNSLLPNNEHTPLKRESVDSNQLEIKNTLTKGESRKG